MRLNQRVQALERRIDTGIGTIFPKELVACQEGECIEANIDKHLKKYDLSRYAISNKKLLVVVGVTPDKARA